MQMWSFSIKKKQVMQICIYIKNITDDMSLSSSPNWCTLGLTIILIQPSAIGDLRGKHHGTNIYGSIVMELSKMGTLNVRMQKRSNPEFIRKFNNQLGGIGTYGLWHDNKWFVEEYHSLGEYWCWDFGIGGICLSTRTNGFVVSGLMQSKRVESSMRSNRGSTHKCAHVWVLGTTESACGRDAYANTCNPAIKRLHQLHRWCLSCSWWRLHSAS